MSQSSVYSSVQIEGQTAPVRNAVMSSKKACLLALLGFTAFGLLSFEYRYLDDLARGHAHTFAMRMFEEMTGAYVGLIIFAPLVWIVRTTRIHRDNWVRTLPMNLLALVAFSACDTALMSLARRLLAPLFGLGEYDYGIMVYRYPMEFAKHIPLFAITLGAIYVIDSYREARDRQVASADLEARLAEAQLRNLRLQLQPHFLFNALNTVSSVMHENVDRADRMLADLGDLLRQTLREVHSQEVTLHEELGMLRKYLSIMTERLGDDLKFDIAVDPDAHDALVPQLILQPLVENSIRYARDPGTLGVTVHVAVIRDGTHLLLQVCDKGPGIPDLEKATWRKGIGLSNTEQRLNGLYGADHVMVLKNAGGLTVTIRVPFRTEARAI